MRTTALRRRPTVPALLLSVLLPTALTLAACSPSSTGSYCDVLRSAESGWKDIGNTLKDPAAAARFAATIARVQASAPDEVKADWASLRTLVETFAVAKPDLTTLTKQMQGFEASAKRIETHAKETCGVDLGR